MYEQNKLFNNKVTLKIKKNYVKKRETYENQESSPHAAPRSPIVRRKVIRQPMCGACIRKLEPVVTKRLVAEQCYVMCCFYVRSLCVQCLLIKNKRLLISWIKSVMTFTFIVNKKIFILYAWKLNHTVTL